MERVRKNRHPVDSAGSEPGRGGALRIGEWRVDPASCHMARGPENVRLELRTMRLLLCLAEHAGEVVRMEDLLDRVWAGVFVSQDSVYQAVAGPRRQLGDDSKQPTYIETVTRIGYRMVAKVEPVAEEMAPAKGGAEVRSHPRRAGRRWAASAALGLALAVVALFAYPFIRPKDHRGGLAAAGVFRPAEKSIAVLPFLDLTKGMREEEFADGMTEELIDKLSKEPGMRVPAPTSSFYFKGKQIPVAEIARRLGVDYVLDGSVRESGGRMRVAARLVRAENGYVIWSESYDRSAEDVLKVQDDIAGEVLKALEASIEARPGK